MGTTEEFIKLRSAGTPKTGEWNINYSQALAQAKSEYKFIITSWSNGDACSFCVKAERCMMTDVFKNWMKNVDAYFVFQYSGDKDRGQIVHDWIYKSTKLTLYPGFRITLYNPSTGKPVFDRAIDGDSLRNNKGGELGAKAMIANLEAMLANKLTLQTTTEPAVNEVCEYKVRLNEKLTVKKVNSILDAIDSNEGYCPCQPRSEGTKCHCEDFINNKGIDKPCICKIYVKKSLKAKTGKIKSKPKKAKAKLRK